MATAIELINSKTIGRDRRAVWRGQRRFKIHGGAIDASDFLADPFGQTNGVCPPYFSAWPSGPGTLILDSYDVVPNDNVLDVVANYSSDGSYRFPDHIQKFDNLPLWSSWSGSTIDETVKFPYAALTRKTHEITGATYDAWLIEGDMEIKTAMRVMTRPVVITTNPGQQNRDNRFFEIYELIERQQNKIHTINGFHYRFEAGGFSEIEPNKWEVNYSWTYDPGHKQLAIDQQALTNVAYPGDGQHPLSWLDPHHLLDPDGIEYAPDRWARPPFCEWTVEFRANPADRPMFWPMRPYAVEPDGHKTLPGIQL